MFGVNTASYLILQKTVYIDMLSIVQDVVSILLELTYCPVNIIQVSIISGGNQ